MRTIRKTWTFPPNCKKGHPYGPNPPRDHHGARICLQCRTGWRLCAHCQLKPVTRKRSEYCSKACSNATRGRRLVERFHEFYQPGKPDECWPWNGPRDSAGYGVITDDNRQQLRAHRLVFETNHGRIPDGKYACHHCDNPPCVNPAHLFLGTAADNNEDKRRKSRHVYGESHPGAKLTEADVRAIRALYPRMTQTAIAARYGLDQTTVSEIILRKKWRHI